MIPLFDVVIDPKLGPGQLVLHGSRVTAGSREVVERFLALANEEAQRAPPPPPEHPIPPMTDPLGRHWDQPARERILVDETHAVMDEATAARLSRYDRSVPSGVYAGKMWRRMNWLCWFVDGPGPKECTIVSREILVLGGAP